MRVFELARELNVPSKDLLTRLQGLGYKLDGNFNDLDESTVAEIKTRLLEPVSRIEESPGEGGGEDAEAEPEQPRRRRIISARKSTRAKTISKSLGIDEPQAEDVKTREAVPPATEEGLPAGAGEVAADAAPEAPPAGPDEEPVRTRRLRKPTAKEAAEAEAAEAAAEPGGTPQEAPPAEDGGTEAPPLAAAEDTAADTAPAPSPLGNVPPPVVEEVVGRRGGSERMRHIPLPKPVLETEDGIDSGRGGGQWREMRRGAGKRTPSLEEPVPAGKGQWREMRRRRGGAEGEDEWARPRRRGPGKRGRLPKVGEAPKHTFNPRQKAIRIGDSIRVGELAGATGIKAADIIRKLMSLDIMVTVNDMIDGETAEVIAGDYNVAVELAREENPEDIFEATAIPEDMQEPRPPIITIMGHVDHGKTTLLDFIRSSHIASGEAGGITQHIGAYYVEHALGGMVFLDTPGHEAFTALRQRGADITDLVVLIVGADDGVMPQTVEAIDHAKAAEVPLIVAMNKMDRPNADPDKIKRQLMEHSLVAEEFGGDTVVVPISAKSGEGVDALLEIIHLQAEMLELKSTSQGPARGFVIEAQMDRQRGPVATVITQQGTLRVGDHFAVGSSYGRVRAMTDDKGLSIEEATPSLPVEVLGYSELPEAGDLLVVVEDEKTARMVAETRSERLRTEESQSRRRVHLEDFLSQTAGKEEVVQLNMILKADAQGSLEALRTSLEREGNDSVRVEIIRAGVGGITETDISLASTSDAVVIGFNVRPAPKAAELARNEGIDVKTYTIIYELLDDIHAALQGMLRPVIREEVIGHLEVKDVFNATKEGRIAGGQVTEGRMDSGALIRVYRDNVIIHTGLLNSLRRFKDDVAHVQAGQECGFRIANFQDLRPGDMLEAFVRVEETPTLDRPGQSSG